MCCRGERGQEKVRKGSKRYCATAQPNYEETKTGGSKECKERTGTSREGPCRGKCEAKKQCLLGERKHIFGGTFLDVLSLANPTTVSGSSVIFIRCYFVSLSVAYLLVPCLGWLALRFDRQDRVMINKMCVEVNRRQT
mmetsp:Transcript_8280/g.11740  ORF Transcript_8280/g.11740 Transcript_8280/m.11740 type:complete len:138 (+) Transcript_8280:640-1053(+)